MPFAKNACRIVVLSVMMLITLPLTVAAQNLFTSPIVATDVTNFWTAFDELERDTTQNPFIKYVAIGTPALAEMSNRMIGGPEKLKKHVLKRIDFYRKARSTSQDWLSYVDKINYAIQQFSQRVPGVNLPTIYLVIGRENCGGTIGGGGIIAGLETYCYASGEDPFHLNRDMDNLPETIVELLVWYNLRGYQENNLLQTALCFGSATFFSKICTRDLHIKNPVSATSLKYGDEHRCEIWNSFIVDRNDEDHGDWFWKYDLSRPANLGGWAGFTIVTEYYNKNKMNNEATRDLLNLATLKAFAEENMVDKFCK